MQWKFDLALQASENRLVSEDGSIHRDELEYLGKLQRYKELLDCLSAWDVERDLGEVFEQQFFHAKEGRECDDPAAVEDAAK